MRNQIAAAERMGLRAVTINSDNRDEWENVEHAIKRNDVDILLISPERLANDQFRNQVLSQIAARIALLVIDEAHCISDWGHDFRPHYRLIERMIRSLPPQLRLLATTATANNRVMNDLCEVLGPKLDVSRGDLNRPSLMLQTICLPNQEARMAWLAEQLMVLPGSGIIYTLTVRDANQVSEWLKSCGLNVEAYTGQTGDRRGDLEQALLDNKVKALVVTTALVMGFDKPDLALVKRWKPQPPPAWVTCVPSQRHPHLVPEFARNLAAELGIPFHAVIMKTESRPEQKTMANSTQQARNLDGSIGLTGEPVLASPVLLIDDMVDSRWTLTVASWILRANGSGEVLPLALALAGKQ